MILKLILKPNIIYKLVNPHAHTRLSTKLLRRKITKDNQESSDTYTQKRIKQTANEICAGNGQSFHYIFFCNSLDTNFCVFHIFEAPPLALLTLSKTLIVIMCLPPQFIHSFYI